jgi:hypothetical protein
MPDGSDLLQKGIKGVGQGKGVSRTAIDDKYDSLEKEGKLASAPWAKNLPWTNEGAAKLGKLTADAKKAEVAKSVPAKKPQSQPNTTAPKPVTEEKKKGFFGLF